jgi:hypothetical protein
MKRYECYAFESLHFNPLPQADMRDDKDGEYYLCTDIDALLAQCEEAFERLEDWEGYIPPHAKAALSAIRAARTP